MPTPRRSQVDRSQTTRSTLITTARTLFTERGYQGVPADEIVRAAGVSRGALYHHFDGKPGLFRSVFEQLEEEITTAVTDAVSDAPPGDAMVIALGAFLDLCARPDVVRIALVEAPVVLGWAEWRELESRYGLGLIQELLDHAAGAGILSVAPSPTLAQILLSAVIEAVLTIAYAEDHDAARAEGEAVLLTMLAGLLKA